MKTTNGSKVISNSKVKAVISNANDGNLGNLKKFVEKDLLLEELAQRKVGDQPLISEDDKIFAGLVLAYASEEHGRRKRHSGRLFLGHPIDAARGYNDAYLSFFDQKRQKGWPTTMYNIIDTATLLCHDLIEDEWITKEELKQTLTTRVLDSKIEKKDKYTRNIIPVVANNVEALTREYSYLNLWEKIAIEWTRKLDGYKIADKTSNVNELEKLGSDFSRFINTHIKDPVKSTEWINYPSRRILNALSTFSHKRGEGFLDLMHKLEIKNRLYPNPKTLHEIFKSFIIIDATNSHMQSHVRDDFLILLKQGLIKASLEQNKRVSEHVLKHHCTGLKRWYAISKVKKDLMYNPLLIIDEHYLKKLQKKSAVFRNMDLTDTATENDAQRYFKTEYEKRKTGRVFTVGDVIHLNKVFHEYIMTDGVDRLTYARKDPRKHPFDNLINQWLIKIARDDKKEKIMQGFIKEHETQYKLTKALNYKLFQYLDNHSVTFDWGMIQSMKLEPNGTNHNGNGSKQRKDDTTKTYNPGKRLTR